MTDPTKGARPAAVSAASPPDFPWRRVAFATAVLTACFGWPLYELLRFSLGSELYSHIFLIPFISLYLVWYRRESLPPSSPPNRILAGLLLAGGLAVLAVYGLATRSARPLAPDDSLAFTTFSFLLLLTGLWSLLIGRARLRAAAFPIGLLIFMVPFPTVATEWIDSFLQQGSAVVAAFLFNLTGTPLLRQDLLFHLPDISLQIAPECSGIHSSLALFITSLVAGYFFLGSRVNRAVLAFSVVPLALVRNGFRVWVIGELCVHIGPQMINSYIHRKGGPIFFVLSLIPFTLLLWALVRLEQRRSGATRQT